MEVCPEDCQSAVCRVDRVEVLCLWVVLVLMSNRCRGERLLLPLLLLLILVIEACLKQESLPDVLGFEVIIRKLD